MSDVEIRRGYVPGVIGRMVEMHGTYYHKHWGFGAFFEAKVAGGLAEFIHRFDAERDGLWSAVLDGRIEGAIAMDGIHAGDEGAHLRWFILSDALRGKGIGGRLLRHAMDFCRQKNYHRVFLWTFEGLLPARHLYDKEGFVLVAQHRGSQWGTEVTEQRLERRLP